MKHIAPNPIFPECLFFDGSTASVTGYIVDAGTGFQFVETRHTGGLVIFTDPDLSLVIEFARAFLTE